ncbi:MAG: DsrE family protein [Massilia sp.]
MKKVPDRRSVVVNSIALAAATVCASSAAEVSARAPGTPRYSVVFQVSDADPAKWSLTLNNVRNAQAELGADGLRIEVVAFGPGIGMLKAGSDVAARVTEALKAGVNVLACQNTMRGQNLAEAQMVSQIAYVPSGVAHLIRRQAEGYAYIRS